MTNLWKAYTYILNDQTKSEYFRELSLTCAVENCQRYKKHKFQSNQIVQDCYWRTWRRLDQRSKAIERKGIDLACQV